MNAELTSTSLLIVTRNRAAQLQHGLRSIDRQGYRGVDALLVDDGSTDETALIATEHARWLRYLRIDRSGGYRKNPAAPFNVGHAQCRGDVVIEQSGEVCHLNDCIRPLVRACRPGIVSLATVYNGDADDMAAVQYALLEGLYEPGDDLLSDAPECDGNKLSPVPRVMIGKRAIELYCGIGRQAPFMFLGAIHRADFEAIGGYDETIAGAPSMGNDQDLARRLVQRGVIFHFCTRAVAFHLRHDKT